MDDIAIAAAEAGEADEPTILEVRSEIASIRIYRARLAGDAMRPAAVRGAEA